MTDHRLALLTCPLALAAFPDEVRSLADGGARSEMQTTRLFCIVAR
jgi:hypothetical protein